MVWHLRVEADGVEVRSRGEEGVSWGVGPGIVIRKQEPTSLSRGGKKNLKTPVAGGGSIPVFLETPVARVADVQDFER